MKQLIYIWGWDCFRNEDDMCEALKAWPYQPFQETPSWKQYLKSELADEYEMAMPTMPNAFDARYIYRKIWFERILPALNAEPLVVVGYSLWGIFLAKYLSENVFPKKIAQLHLVAAVLDESDLPEGDDYIADFGFDPVGLEKLTHQVDKIFLYHSKDDPIVPISHMQRFHHYLPQAIINVFEDRGHFWQPEFPELLQNIKAAQ